MKPPIFQKSIAILLADDDADDREFFSIAFNEATPNSTLTTVNDGEELMQYLEAAATLPHIVFLDLNMPRKNGTECLLEIRAQSRFHDMAVAIYSTASGEQYIEEMFVNGANVYLRKPSSLSELKAMIQHVILTYYQMLTLPLNRANFFLTVSEKF